MKQFYGDLFQPQKLNLGLLPRAARADTLTFFLNTTFNGTAPTSASPWLKAVFSNTCGTDCVNLTLTSSLNVASEFITEVAFNVNPNITPSSVTVAQSGGSPNVTSIDRGTQDGQNLTGGGNAAKKFDFKINWSPAAGSGRFDGTDVNTFTFTMSGLTVADFNYTNTGGNNGVSTNAHFAAHVQGIPTGEGSGAIKDGGSVPDGGMTLMLLGGVLVGLETLRRKFPV